MRYLAPLTLCLLALGLSSLSKAKLAFGLRSGCPASFELRNDGKCHFVSLYDLYVAAPGQGGMRVPLPPMRQLFTPAQADLGRYLFFDPLLSGNHRLACAHCHNPGLGFSDGRATSVGRGGKGLGPERTGGAAQRRSAPTLWNVGFLERLCWDGRASSLQAQATGPLFAADEMGNTAEQLEHDLNANAAYRELFATAFARAAEQPIRMTEVLDALAAFESTLVSFNSRYDQYAHGNAQALSSEEIRGLNVFRGFVGRCAQCHIPPLFASSDVVVVGAPPVPGKPYDLGAGEGSSNPAAHGAFKIPTLRNIACTAPYFQAGQFNSLEEVVRFYNAPRGHAVPRDIEVKVHWHVHMNKPELTEADVKSLVSFLETLTDQSMTPAAPVAVPSGLPVPPNAQGSCTGQSP
jgi:cytochrome c peroxidase